MTDYTVGDYLLDRLVELGVSEVFGVPGDFNLEFLDHIVTHESVRWVEMPTSSTQATPPTDTAESEASLLW